MRGSVFLACLVSMMAFANPVPQSPTLPNDANNADIPIDVAQNVDPLKPSSGSQLLPPPIPFRFRSKVPHPKISQNSDSPAPSLLPNSDHALSTDSSLAALLPNIAPPPAPPSDLLPDPNDTTDANDDTAAAVTLFMDKDGVEDGYQVDSPNLPGTFRTERNILPGAGGPASAPGGSSSSSSSPAPPAAAPVKPGSGFRSPPSSSFSGEGQGAQTLEPLPPIEPNETARARARQRRKDYLDYDPRFDCSNWVKEGGIP